MSWLLSAQGKFSCNYYPVPSFSEMFFHLNVHVLRGMYENESDEIIYHLEKKYMVHFQLTRINKKTTSLVSYKYILLKR